MGFFISSYIISMINTSTVYDLIYGSLRMAGVAALGDSVDAAVSNEALMLLNAIRAENSLNVRNNIRYDKVYNATDNKQYITLGTDNSQSPAITGDIATRPSDITEICILVNNSSGTPVSYKIPIYSFDEYRALPVQNVYAFPQAAYIDNQYPLQYVYFYSGLASGYSVRIIGNSYFTDYENVADPYIDPPEYWQFLMIDLAMRLLTMYGQDVPAGLLSTYNAVSKHVKNHNFKFGMKRTRNDIKASGNGFNFLAGYGGR